MALQQVAGAMAPLPTTRVDVMMQSETVEITYWEDAVSKQWRRPKEELTERTLQRMGKKLGTEPSLLDHTGNIVEPSLPCHAAWYEARFFSTNGTLVEIYRDPPVITSLDMSSEVAYEGVPVVPIPVTNEGTTCTIQWRFSDGRDAIEAPYFIASGEDNDEVVEVVVTPVKDGMVGDSISKPIFIRTFPEAIEEKYREWPSPSPDVIRAATYNLLADGLAGGNQKARSEQYWYVSDRAIDGKYREQLAIRDILAMQPSVIGLQEVGAVFFKRMEAALQTQGYRGFFTTKQAGNQGSAMFWRDDRWEVVDTTGLRLFGDDLLSLMPNIEEKVRQCSAVYDALQLPNTMAQLATLEDKRTGRRVLVTNTHLYYHPECNHIRLLQLYGLLSYVRQKYTAGDGEGVIVLGDFNTRMYDVPIRRPAERPDELAINSSTKLRLGGDHVVYLTEDGKSPVHVHHIGYRGARGCIEINRGEVVCTVMQNGLEDLLGGIVQMVSSGEVVNDIPEAIPAPIATRLLKNKRVEKDDVDWMWTNRPFLNGGLPDPTSPEELRLALEHPFPSLVNPYPDLPLTTCIPAFVEVLDYVLYDDSCFRVVWTMPATPREELGNGIPDETHPSDHLPVLVDLAWQ